ncbi:MAG: radical SAM protein [bacterium]
MNDRERLLLYYAGGRLFTPRPRYLCFNATLRCDSRCLHCGIWEEEKPGPELGADELRHVLARPFFDRIETAWLTGGEPTLREDVGALARALVKSLPSLSTLGIATNALSPDRVLERVESLAKVSLGAVRSVFIHVSLDGIGETHDQVRRKKGAFEAVVETIDRLSALRASLSGPVLEIGLNCVIQPLNVGNLEEIYQFSRERSLPLLFNVAMITDQVYRSKSREAELKLSEDDRQKTVEFLERIMPESPPPLRYQYRNLKTVLTGGTRPYRCLTLYSTVNINADGTLIPCPASSDLFPRNVLYENMDELWRSADMLKLRKKVHRDLCPSCMLSCSLGDSMPLSEWLKGGWDGKAGRFRSLFRRAFGGGAHV